jgi:2',3'-cyclic-nucleotide 2'-phosphodiesterase / 3'-nucleotidase
VLAGTLQARDMVEAARQATVALRAAGADVVVCLAHTGLGDAEIAAENVGAQLAQVAGIDALILGHEHRVFPEPGHTGLLGGRPAVMPGAFGSHLGVIDLVLRRDKAGWRVAEASSACRPVATRGAFGEPIALVEPDRAMVAAASESHAGTRRWMTRQVGQTQVALHSYFAVAQPTAMQALIAEAQAAHLAEMVVGTRWADLPILSAVAPFKTGGRGGPEYFTHVAAGPVLLRHAADLYVHPNRFAAIAITGAGLREWLERAASAYTQVLPGVQDQPLLDPRFPATCLEMIAGLSYTINLSAAARYEAPTGRLIGGAGRIGNLRFNGKEVARDRLFALATNSHRLGVLQHIMGAGACEVIVDGIGSLGSRDVLVRHLARSHVAPLPSPMAWTFRALPGTSVTLDTAPAAVAHVADMMTFTPENLGLTEAGFLRFRLHL